MLAQTEIGKALSLIRDEKMIKIPDALVLNLVVSACRATLGDGDIAMQKPMLIVAHVGNWASYTLAGKAEYALERYRYVSSLRGPQIST